MRHECDAFSHPEKSTSMLPQLSMLTFLHCGSSTKARHQHISLMLCHVGSVSGTLLVWGGGKKCQASQALLLCSLCRNQQKPSFSSKCCRVVWTWAAPKEWCQNQFSRASCMLGEIKNMDRYHEKWKLDTLLPELPVQEALCCEFPETRCQKIYFIVPTEHSCVDDRTIQFTTKKSTKLFPPPTKKEKKKGVYMQQNFIFFYAQSRHQHAEQSVGKL